MSGIAELISSGRENVVLNEVNVLQFSALSVKADVRSAAHKVTTCF
jgi:hypothetical protein